MDFIHLAADIFRRAPANKFTEFEHNRIRDAVVDAVPLSASSNEAAVIQNSQMLGDIRLIGVQLGNDIVDGSLALL